MTMFFSFEGRGTLDAVAVGSHLISHEERLNIIEALMHPNEPFNQHWACLNVSIHTYSSSR